VIKKLKPRYYRLSFDDSSPDPVICRKFNFERFDHYRLLEGSFIDSWPTGVSFYYSEDGFAEDFLGNSLGLLIVSARIRGFLEPMARSECQFLPVQISNSRTEKTLEGYSILNLLNRVSALDKVNAIYKDDTNNPHRPIILTHLTQYMCAMRT